jgi:hypothetical protein
VPTPFDPKLTSRGWALAQAIKHGSWLNLVEGFFSKLARSVLHHIRVASKQNSRIASWPRWSFSTATRSFTHGPAVVEAAVGTIE